MALGGAWKPNAPEPSATLPPVVETADDVTVSAEPTKAEFARKTGTLRFLEMNGRRILADRDGRVSGPRLEVNRGFVDNDKWLRGKDPSQPGSYRAFGLTQKAYHPRPLAVTADGRGGGVRGDGVYVCADRNGRPTRNLTVRDVTVTNSYRQGMSVISVKGLRLERVKLLGTHGSSPEAGIDFGNFTIVRGKDAEGKSFIDATKALRSALASDAGRVFVGVQDKVVLWSVGAIRQPTCEKEVIFEDGVLLRAKKGAFEGVVLRDLVIDRSTGSAAQNLAPYSRLFIDNVRAQQDEIVLVSAEQVLDAWAAKRWLLCREEMKELARDSFRLVEKTQFIDHNVCFHQNPPPPSFKYVKFSGIMGVFRDGMDLHLTTPMWGMMTEQKTPGRAAIRAEKAEAERLAVEGLRKLESVRDRLDPGEYARQHRAWSIALVGGSCR